MKAVQRNLIEATGKIASIAYSGLDPETGGTLDEAEMLSRAEHIIIDVDVENKSSGIQLQEFGAVLKRIEERQKKMREGIAVPGIDPLLPTLRRALPYGVLERGWLIGIGANPKTGKSIYAANIVAKALKQGKNVVLIGTEMLAEENATRIIPMLGFWLGKDLPAIKTTELLLQVKNEEHKASKTRTIAALQELIEWYAEQCPGNLLMVDEPVKVSSLRSGLAREQMKWGSFDLVVVDHIGMLLPETDRYQSETQRMNAVSADLLKLARCSLLGNPTLIFVSPFTKGEATDLPGMHRFRDSFMLAHNAHLLIGLCKDADDTLQLHVAGQRSTNPAYQMPEMLPIIIRPEDGLIVEAMQQPLESLGGT
jgi:replicative DNA helicase